MVNKQIEKWVFFASETEHCKPEHKHPDNFPQLLKTADKLQILKDIFFLGKTQVS